MEGPHPARGAAADRAPRPPAAAANRGRSRLRRGARPLIAPFRVAFVCTGNRFRSPLAAALLAAEAEGLPVEVTSLGTLELGAVPALPEAVAIAQELGHDLTSHRARRIDDLGAYDLVVGFERKHVMAAVVDAGAAVEKTFTLPELVALLKISAPLPPEPRERLAKANTARPPDFRNAPLPEIADPLGLSAPEQQEIARQVERQVSDLAAALFD